MWSILVRSARAGAFSATRRGMVRDGTPKNCAGISRRPSVPSVRESARSFSIRTIGPADLPVMRRMLRMFAEAFDDAASYASKPPADAYLSRLLASEAFIALAALKGDDVVGGLAGYELKKFEQERSEIYIYDLAVA